MRALLAGAARHGRILLVAGLLTGLLFPSLAAVMRPWLPQLVAALVFLAALRIGPREAIGAVRDLPAVIGVVLLYQLALPLVLASGFAAAGLAATPLALALVLMTAASPISGSPNLTILTGGDPASALRLLVVGTALLPVTVLPVFLIVPGLGGAGAVFVVTVRLLGVIFCAAGAAFLLRRLFLRRPEARSVAALDGVSAIAMAVIVVGLMSEAGPMAMSHPMRFAGWLALALSANLGLQILAFRLCRALSVPPGPRVALSISAGNRNIALFLVALPPEVTDQLLAFIGCYQVPMYLTPILLRRSFRG